MRARNLNTMYRRRTVRPDGRVYRQTRKLAGAARAGGAPLRVLRRGSGATLIGVLIVAAVVVTLVLAWRAYR